METFVAQILLHLRSWILRQQHASSALLFRQLDQGLLQTPFEWNFIWSTINHRKCVYCYTITTVKLNLLHRNTGHTRGTVACLSWFHCAGLFPFDFLVYFCVASSCVVVYSRQCHKLSLGTADGCGEFLNTSYTSYIELQRPNTLNFHTFKYWATSQTMSLRTNKTTSRTVLGTIDSHWEHFLLCVMAFNPTEY